LVSIAGSRELELVFFTMKNQLRVLHIGQYIYDEMLTYIAEMCHQTLEKLEVNSEKVTDRGITPLFTKMVNMKYIDLAGCPNFTGLAIFEAGEHYGAKCLKRFVHGLTDIHNKQKVTERLAEVAPEC
jgi:hypothetical protein